MLKLIKLELRKNNILPYIIASFFIFVFTFAFCFMVVILPEVPETIPSPIDINDMFSNFSNIIPVITIIPMSFFAILSSVMHAKFSVEEYTGKKSVLLFSYPQKRSQILRAKCIFIFVFVSIIMMITNITAISLFGLISNTFGLLSSDFMMTEFILLLKFTIISSILSSVIGLIALRVGFARKSIIATIITAVLLISPFGNIISFFADSAVIILVSASLVLIIISFVLFIELLSKVNKMESL